MVTPQSESAGRHVGNVDGDGGGVVDPVNPHSPSWCMRGRTDSGRFGGMMGRRVQIRVCSISGGTESSKHVDETVVKPAVYDAYLSTASHS